MLDATVATGCQYQTVRKIRDGHLRPAPDVECTRQTSSLSGLDIGLNYVAHVNEVSRLRSVSVNNDGFATQEPKREYRDYVTVGIKTLIRPVYVEVSKTNDLKAMNLRIRKPKLLLAEFGATIGSVRFNGMVLGNWQCLQLTKDARGRRNDYFPNPSSPR